MWIYFVILFIIGLIDTLIGNRLFPSKVEVLNLNDDTMHCYRVMKITRVFFIPIKMYLLRECITRDFTNFTTCINHSQPLYEGESIKLAKIYSNTYNETTLSKSKTVWSSRTKPVKTDVELLYMSAGKAFMDKNEEEGNRILDEIKQFELKKIIT